MKRAAMLTSAVACVLAGIVLLLANNNSGLAVLMVAQQLFAHAPKTLAE